LHPPFTLPLFLSSSLPLFISSSLHLFISSSLHLFISSSRSSLPRPHLSFASLVLSLAGALSLTFKPRVVSRTWLRIEEERDGERRRDEKLGGGGMEKKKCVTSEGFIRWREATRECNRRERGRQGGEGRRRGPPHTHG